MRKILCTQIAAVMAFFILSGCTSTSKKVPPVPSEKPLSEPTLDISDISVMPQGKETNGLYHKFQLTYGTQVKQFEGNHLSWWDAPKIYMIDVNDDQAKEIVVVLTAAHGTGCLIEELHVFDAITLREYNCTNVFDVISDTLNLYFDSENYYIQSPLNLFTVPKSTFYAEQNQLFDSIGIGEFITFSVDSDSLFCTLGCQIVADSFCGYLNIGLEVDYNDIHCLTYDYTPSSEPASQSPVPSISIPATVTFPEIPVDDYTRSCPVPDFLDKDQQHLYHQALYVYNHLFGGDTSEVCIGNEDKFPDKEYTVARNGILYTKATGRYAVWTDFDGMIHSVFTDNFWTGCNDNTIFINIDGTLYYLNAAMGREYRNENFPDTFKLNSKTDNEIIFTLTGYYSSPWPNEGETYEQRDQRLKNGWEYTLDFTIKLVRTADGWRFDEFHSTAGDQVGPEEAG